MRTLVILVEIHRVKDLFHTLRHDPRQQAQDSERLEAPSEPCPRQEAA